MTCYTLECSNILRATGNNRNSSSSRLSLLAKMNMCRRGQAALVEPQMLAPEPSCVPQRSFTRGRFMSDETHHPKQILTTVIFFKPASWHSLRH